MPSEISPKKLMQAREQGTKRMANARASRLMFLRQFCGQYYDADHGTVGSEPLNLIFNAIRVLVPNLVFNHPVHNVTTKFAAQRNYAEMLGMALCQQDKQLKMKEKYRRWIVDGIFQLGILKTGVCDSGTSIGFSPDDRIDPGTVYTENVDFDNFVFAPNAHSLEESLFLGDRVRVPRVMLLDSGLYKNDQIERLPSANSDNEKRDRVEQLSARGLTPSEIEDVEDEVEIFELWVPRAKAIVTVPGCDSGFTTDDFLRVHDYYGPDDGPYTFLRMTPPVPNNPLPISMVGIWHDLHIMANRMVKKIMDQADRQKDLIGYKRSAADDAQEALEASDGEAIAMDDPDGVKTFSFGGQQTSNEQHVQQLQMWFNMMAGNPEGMSGMSMNAKSATEANMLQANAQTSLEDMKDMVYGGVAEEGRKRAWYLHTDPMIEVPLIRRIHQPAQFQQTPNGPMMSQPPQQQEVQVFLTPEARCGDFLDFTFEIEPESMARVDSQKRLATAMEFAVKILPAAASAAQTCAMMGVAFSFPRFATLMAKEAGIKWMDEVFMDPEYQQQMMLMMMRGPQQDQSKGQAAPQAGGGLPGIMQNGQPPGVGATMAPDQQAASFAQTGANAGQAGLPTKQGY